MYELKLHFCWTRLSLPAFALILPFALADLDFHFLKCGDATKPIQDTISSGDPINTSAISGSECMSFRNYLADPFKSERERESVETLSNSRLASMFIW